MSLIYIATDSESTEATVDALYHNMEVESPIWPRASEAAGNIRFEMFISADNPIGTLYVGIPHQNLNSIEDSSDLFVENFSDRIIGTRESDLFEYSGSEYQLQRLSKHDIKVSDDVYDGIQYTVVTLEASTADSNIALSFKFQIEAMAINIADSLFSETTWSLDVTLYGPVNPREHSFLTEDEMEISVLEVKSGYSYLYLPKDTFPKIVSPDPLESFYRASRQRFYYTWVLGNLDPWYEQRMMITYGSHDGNYLTAILLSVIASLIFVFISAAPDLVTASVDIVSEGIRAIFP